MTNQVNKKKFELEQKSFLIAALYHFVKLEKIEGWQKQFKKMCAKNSLFGTILIAHEGINGTIAGNHNSINSFVRWLRKKTEFEKIAIKYSQDHNSPFNRMKVRLKKEIVTMGKPDINPSNSRGVYIKPRDWNELISSPDVLLIDTRNNYEVEIGRFQNALNPSTTSFRDFPQWADNFALSTKNKRQCKIAMYCTGGIRCEKSTAYLKTIGFDEVYHLEGGILKYLEEIPSNQSLWQGECFVFDNRVSVDHKLQKGAYSLCNACRHPLSNNDIKSVSFQTGVSCPYCISKTTSQQKERFKERQKQIKLAKNRGLNHIGASFRSDKYLGNN